ncbi:MAG TPA: 50S ribosomal protein L6 [bacterium]|nr:50S ribosomal protein L6 [bacterium]
MARIAKKPIEIPAGVKVKIEGQKVTLEGPKGSETHEVLPGLKVELQGQQLLVSITGNERALGAVHGLVRALLKNIVNGVAKGFERKLEIQGVGYRAAMEKGKLSMSLGFSHPVVMELPKGVSVDIEKQTMLTVKGANKYLVGETAAKIRRVKPPEVYKGTGIRYLGEQVRKKVGKTGATGKAGGK